MPRFLEITGAVLGVFVLAVVAAWGYWLYTPSIAPDVEIVSRYEIIPA